jgi:HlyD family secretion protein
MTQPLNFEKTSSSLSEENKQTWSSYLQNTLDQPPANLPLMLIVGGAVFCFIFGIWAYFGKIEEVGKAVGELVPQGKTYKIEPLELGKVDSVSVREGEKVTAGQTLVELDKEIESKEIQRLEQLLQSYRLELSQKLNLLEKLIQKTETQLAIASTDIQSTMEGIKIVKQKIDTQNQLFSDLKLKEKDLKKRLGKIKPIKKISEKHIEQLRLEESAHQKRLETLTVLAEEGAVSQDFIFQIEQSLRQIQRQITQTELQDLTNTDGQLFEIQQSIKDIHTKMIETEGQLILAVREREKLKIELNQKQIRERQIKIETEEAIQELEVEISKIKAKIAETQNSLLKNQAKLKQQTLKTPVDGVVLSLDLQNTGQVVQSGETLIEVAPKDAPLILSAILPNEEAGLVKKGMPAKIKFDAYPYQDYGLINGKVISISSDSETNEQLGEVYRVEIELERNYIMEESEKVTFKPGQTASAEIILRRRRIINVLLEPLQKIQKSGISL